MAIFSGKFIEVTAVRRLTTLQAAPERLAMIPGNEDFASVVCLAMPVQLVEFKFTSPDGKVPTTKLGEAVREFADWVHRAATEGVESFKLDTTIGIAFSGVAIAHIGFALGHATHFFPWAGFFEPRTGGGWVGHAHGAPVRDGDPFFLDLTQDAAK